MKNLTDENFESELKNAGKPAVVDFFAEWCGPCTVLGPILEKVAGETLEFEFFKANVDNTPKIAQKFNVDRIPNVILFKDGKPVSSFIGLKLENEIKEWLDANN